MKKIFTILVIVVVIAVIAFAANGFLTNQEPNENVVENGNTQTELPNEDTEKDSSDLEENDGELSNGLGEIENAEALSAIIDKVYAEQTMEMPMLETRTIDVTDKDTVSTVTGLEDGDDLEYVVASEPMMSSQAYSFVLVKVKDGVNTDKIAKTMCDNIDARKWICVTAEKVYTTSSGNVVCLIMSNEDTAKPIYETFKKLAGTIGQEYEKTAEEPELPEDMY